MRHKINLSPFFVPFFPSTDIHQVADTENNTNILAFRLNGSSQTGPFDLVIGNAFAGNRNIGNFVKQENRLNEYQKAA